MDNQQQSPKTIRVTEQILLKQIELSDSLDIFTTIDTQREYLGKWLPFVKSTQNVEYTKTFIQSVLNTPEDNREYTFVIHFDGIFAGLIGFRGTDRANKKTEIGYWLSESFQKKGLITQSVKSLMAFAFNELYMNRIQIKCAVGNIPSKNIPKKLGYTFEGVERDGELQSDGLFADIEVYSRLKNE